MQLTGDNSSSMVAYHITEAQGTTSYLFLTVGRQFTVAMVVLDGWLYAWHRYMHKNRFLYRHMHSWHHIVVVPYAIGSQYNHPVEGLLLDTLGGALAVVISGMSPRAFIIFFSLGTIKGVEDHCGRWLPGNIFHLCFWNKHSIPRCAPPAAWQQVQFFAAILCDVGQGLWYPYVLRAGGEARWRAPSKSLRAKATHNGENIVCDCDTRPPARFVCETKRIRVIVAGSSFVILFYIFLLFLTLYLVILSCPFVFIEKMSVRATSLYYFISYKKNISKYMVSHAIAP